MAGKNKQGQDEELEDLDLEEIEGTQAEGSTPEASAEGTEGEEEKGPKVPYWQTEKGKAAHSRWSNSEKGKARMKEYRQTDKYKEMRTKYQNSEKGKAARQRYQAKRQALLKAAKPLELEGDSLVVEVAYPFHKQQLELGRYKTMVEAAMAEVFSTPLILRYVLRKATPAISPAMRKHENISGAVEDEEIVRVAEEIFGGKET